MGCGWKKSNLSPTPRWLRGVDPFGPLPGQSLICVWAALRYWHALQGSTFGLGPAFIKSFCRFLSFVPVPSEKINPDSSHRQFAEPRRPSC